MSYIIGTILLLCSALAAQPHSRAHHTAVRKHHSKSAKTAAFLAGPWASLGGDFPARFIGHNPVLIFDGAIRIAKKYAKSDFETQDQHQARLQNAGVEALTKNLKVSDVLVFTFPASAFDPTYDAETQQMRITFDGMRDRASVEWRSKDKFLRSYTGTNAFGVKKVIKEYARLKYVVAFDHPLFIPGTAYDTDIRVSMPMAPDVARTYMKTLAVALIGRLEFPFADESSETTDPTIDNPYKFHMFERTLNLHLEELRVFDRSSGKVLYTASGQGFRKTHPLRVEILPDDLDYISKDEYVDSVKQDRQILSDSAPWMRTLAGNTEIRLEFYDPDDCSKIRLKVNEKPFTPHCETTGPSYSSHAQIVIRTDQLPAN